VVLETILAIPKCSIIILQQAEKVSVSSLQTILISIHNNTQSFCGVNVLLPALKILIYDRRDAEVIAIAENN